MWSSGDSEQPLLAVVKKGSSQTFAVDVFDCRDYTCIKAVELSKQLYM